MSGSEFNNVTFLNRQRLIERSVDEFIGICKGIIFDGAVCQAEAENLLRWLQANPLVADQFPAKQVYESLINMLDDGEFDYNEEGLFLDLLMQVTGSASVFKQGDNASTQLPLCNPQPPIEFNGKIFVLTGNFSIGPRKLLIDAIEQLGGQVVLKDVRLDTHYLVIGDIGSKAWMHSTHGRKIEKAIELRDQRKTGLAIVSEIHLMKHLQG